MDAPRRKSATATTTQPVAEAMSAPKERPQAIGDPPAAIASEPPTASGGVAVKSYGEPEGGSPAPAAFDPKVPSRIHEIAYDLAITQALAPDQRDSQGFSNADYPLAFVLLAQNDTLALGRLLTLYPRQREARGLSGEDLYRFLGACEPMAPADPGPGLGAGQGAAGEEAGAQSGGYERARSLAILRETRQAIRGQIGWTRLDNGTILINGVQVPSTAHRILTQFCGVRTAQGWFMKEEDSFRVLQRLLREKTEVLNLDALKEIAEGHRPTAPDLDTAAPSMEVLDPELAVLDASTVQGGQVGVIWSNPFSPAGTLVRTTMKDLGNARWSGDKQTGWLTSTVNAYALCLLLEGQPHMETSLLASKIATSLTLSQRAQAESLAEEIQSGRMTIRITGQDEKNVWFVGRRKHDGLSNALYHNHLGRWDGEKGALRVSLNHVEDLLRVCDNMEDLDLSAFLPVIQALQDKRLQRMENRLAITIPERTPGGMVLMPHQPEAVQFLLGSGWDHPSIKGGLLGDDMGLGKTLAAIFAAHLKAPEGRKLVVCPATLKGNWAREVHKVLGKDQKLQIIKTGKDVLDPEATWVICNYDLAKAHQETLAAANFALAIADEAHLLKNPATDRTKAVLGYSRGKVETKGVFDHIPTVWDLTATPVLNRPKELFPLLRSFRHPLGENFFSYGLRFCDATETKYGWDFDGASNLDQLGKEIASVYMKRYKSQVLNLPPKIRQDVLISLPPATLKAYHDGLKGLMSHLKITGRAKGQAVDAEVDLESEKGQHILAEIGAMKQASALAKVQSTIDMAQEIVESGNKVIIWSCYHAVLDQIEAAFPGKVVRIDGTVAPHRRTEAQDLFQEDPEIQVCVATIKVGGVGLTLTQAGYELFNDEEFVPALNDQAEDRAYRIGTTKALNVRKLIGEGTFDADLREILDEKREVISAFEGFSAEAAQAAITKSVVQSLITRLREQQKAAARKAS
jgi:SWI/SNF-related matrix-associated actin-dependent regulator 1 of chromatin subfamily A